jgi:phospholipase C
MRKPRGRLVRLADRRFGVRALVRPTRAAPDRIETHRSCSCRRSSTRLDGAGLTYKVYVDHLNTLRSPCSYFWECVNSKQAKQTVNKDLFVGTRSRRLPKRDVPHASGEPLQHPTFSMMAGDNWIGRGRRGARERSAVGPTAVFLTYDDCGCFYDHVPPPTLGMGLRMPMLIMSPYARPHYVDHSTATLASPLAYIESNWGWRLSATRIRARTTSGMPSTTRRSPSHRRPPSSLRCLRGRSTTYENTRVNTSRPRPPP